MVLKDKTNNMVLLLNETFNLFESFIEFNQTIAVKFAALKIKKHDLLDIPLFNQIQNKNNDLFDTKYLNLNCSKLNESKEDLKKQTNDFDLNFEVIQAEQIKKAKEKIECLMKIYKDDDDIKDNSELKKIQQTNTKLSNFKNEHNLRSRIINNLPKSIHTIPDSKRIHSKCSNQLKTNKKAIISSRAAKNNQRIKKQNSNQTRANKKFHNYNMCDLKNKYWYNNRRNSFKIKQENNLVPKIIFSKNFCSLCNKYFKTLYKLKSHQKVHTGEKPYRCSYCSKCFSHSGNKNKHERIHTGEKPYVCLECGKAFTHSESLKYHHKSHLLKR